MQPPGQGPASQPVAEMFEKMFGMPSPDKILAELQRLNNNIEIMQPNLQKLTQAMEGLPGTDLRNLTAALNKINTGDMMRALNQFTMLMKQVYDRLWSKS